MPNVRKDKPKKRNVSRGALQKDRKMQGPFRAINTADPFTPSKRVKMHYSDNHLLGPGLAGAFGTEIVYRLNSLFNPLFNTGGHQPYAFDQLAILYKKYKVTGVLAEIIYSDPTEDSIVVGVTIQPPDSLKQLTTQFPEQVREQPMSVTRTINNSGKQVGNIKQYIPISSISGLTKLQFQADVDTFTSVVGSNPLATPFLRLAVANDRGTATGNLMCKVKLTYYATFYGRVTQDQS